MLHFVIGTAGTGKTSRLVEEIQTVVAAGGKAILLVPEQFSFECEKLLYRSLGAKGALSVEVLSFTRLCNSVFRMFGGLSGTTVSKMAKYLLMSVAVSELRDSLQVYRKSCNNTAFLETLVEVCSEFKAAGVTEGALAQFARQCQQQPLRDKVSELSLLYSAYQGLLARGYTDPDDDLIRACALLELNSFFDRYTVFVDGFTTFMSAEFELLGHVIVQAKQVYIAMTADGVQDEQKGMGVFSTVKAAAGRLTRLAQAAGIEVAAPELLTVQHRFRNPELEWLGQQFMQPVTKPYPHTPTGSVRLCPAADPYKEIEAVAAETARLVREEGYRYKEIVLVARDTGPYLCAVDAVFTRYGIPYFVDATEDVENKPLMGGVLGAIDAVRSNFDAQAVLLLAKSPVMGLDLQAVAALENYCYCWGVRGAVWHSGFANNPRGLSGALTDEDIAALTAINATRGAVVTPLLALKAAIAQGNGRNFAEGIFDFLQQIHATENLTAYADKLPQGKRSTFLDESAQLWDVLIGILDIFGAVLGNVTLPQSRLCELLRLAVNAAEIGLVPQTLDQVLVGQADRIRPMDTRAVFVIGANEGVFPVQCAASGVFSDAERQLMIDSGVEIAAPTLQKSVLEKFFAYFALTLPSERLTVSYPRSDLLGRELLPSVIVSQLQSLFPELEPQQPEPFAAVAGESSAFQLLASQYHSDTPLIATLLEYFSTTAKSGALLRMKKAALRPPHALMDTVMAKELFGHRLRLSPSRVERYYRCPFSFFASDGLGLRARRRVEFTPLESGSVIHNVLQVMVQRYGGKGLAELTDAQLREEIAQVIGDYLAARIDDMTVLPVRFQYLFARLTGMLARLLRHLGQELAQSRFEPVAFELPINRNEGVEPLYLETVDGTSVIVEGVVDRVDVMNKNGVRYVRVVDYKSGSKSFQLHDILYGLNMQMLLYLFTIQENGAGDLAGGIPAGVLYMPVREKFVSAQRDTADDTVAAQRAKEWRMSGLLLDDEEALRGMEQDIGGIYIPAKLDKNGVPDAKSSLATLAQMGKLSGKVKELVLQLATGLGQGNIPACPVDDDDYKTCTYCDYRAVCGYEQGDAVREIAKLDKEAFFNMLEKEAHNG